MKKGLRVVCIIITLPVFLFFIGISIFHFAVTGRWEMTWD